MCYHGAKEWSQVASLKLYTGREKIFLDGEVNKWFCSMTILKIEGNKQP